MEGSTVATIDGDPISLDSGSNTFDYSVTKDRFATQSVDGKGMGTEVS